MEWASYILGVLSGLSAAGLFRVAELLVRRRAERKVDAAIASDSPLQTLRRAETALAKALHPIPQPVRGTGDDAASKTVCEWKNNLTIAISGLRFSIPNAPNRPIPDPSLADSHREDGAEGC